MRKFSITLRLITGDSQPGGPCQFLIVSREHTRTSSTRNTLPACSEDPFAGFVGVGIAVSRKHDDRDPPSASSTPEVESLVTSDYSHYWLSVIGWSSNFFSVARCERSGMLPWRTSRSRNAQASRRVVDARFSRWTNVLSTHQQTYINIRTLILF